MGHLYQAAPEINIFLRIKQERKCYFVLPLSIKYVCRTAITILKFPICTMVERDIDVGKTDNCLLLLLKKLSSLFTAKLSWRHPRVGAKER